MISFSSLLCLGGHQVTEGGVQQLGHLGQLAEG